MLASWRAELLVLRKSRLAWALVMVAPLVVLVQTYLFGFAVYLGLNPASEVRFGTPAQNLPSLLPGQLVIQAVGDLALTAPFIVLGAVIAGGDWSRGTLRTSLLQGQSRARCFGGQALAVMTACAVSVLLSFALAGLASLAIHGYAGEVATGVASAFPPASVTGEGIGAGLLIGFAYGALGIALGTLCRSAAGGVAAALAWYAIADGFLYELSLDAGRCRLRRHRPVGDDRAAAARPVRHRAHQPAAGGVRPAARRRHQHPDRPVRLRQRRRVPAVRQDRPGPAVLTLAAYALACLALPVAVTLRRDVT